MKISSLLLHLLVALPLAGCASFDSATNRPVAPPVIPAANPEASEVASLYVLKPGDNAVKIAGNHQITVSDLVALNPGVNWTKLKVGQALRIAPLPPSTADTTNATARAF